MERSFDLVVRGGTVVDGAGGQGVEADVGIKDGRIAADGPKADVFTRARLGALFGVELELDVRDGYYFAR